jgi:hypothetical protein
MRGSPLLFKPADKPLGIGAASHGEIGPAQEPDVELAATSVRRVHHTLQGDDRLVVAIRV